MDIKKELGKKIQLLRQDKGLSRQVICQDETLLTTRQLQRIEKGESIPTAPTALYLARQLGVTVDELLDETVYFLPQAYLDLKYQLMRQDHYGEEEKVSQREELLELIYDHYFDHLPEEEQLTIQLLQASMDMIASGNPDFDQNLVTDYLSQVLEKSRLTLNDLLVIKLYFIQQILVDDFNLTILELIEKKIVKAIDYFPLNDLWIIQEVYSGIAEIYCHLKNFERCETMLPIVESLMVKRNDFQDKPLILIIEWKLVLYRDKDRVRAEEKYQSAVTLCELLQKENLKNQVKQEWQADLAIYLSENL